MVIQSKDYIESNLHNSVRLSKFASKYSQSLLNTTENVSDRQKHSQRLMDYLCNKFGIDSIKVYVTSKKRPQIDNRQRYGYYRVNTHEIVIYNTTAKTLKPIAIKTFYETLLHEFIHHYDFQVLKLRESLHTSGFYQRIKDLENKLSK